MREHSEATLRAEVRAWLAENWSPELGLIEWRNRLADFDRPVQESRQRLAFQHRDAVLPGDVGNAALYQGYWFDEQVTSIELLR